MTSIIFESVKKPRQRRGAQRLNCFAFLWRNQRYFTPLQRAASVQFYTPDAHQTVVGYLEAYKRDNHPLFTITVWERTNIESMTRGKSDFLQMHNILRRHVRREVKSGRPKRYMNDWHWGYVNGKFAALRSALGMEWDFLDT